MLADLWVGGLLLAPVWTLVDPPTASTAGGGGKQSEGLCSDASYWDKHLHANFSFPF